MWSNARMTGLAGRAACRRLLRRKEYFTYNNRGNAKSDLGDDAGVVAYMQQAAKSGLNCAQELLGKRG